MVRSSVYRRRANVFFYIPAILRFLANPLIYVGGARFFFNLNSQIWNVAHLKDNAPQISNHFWFSLKTHFEGSYGSLQTPEKGGKKRRNLTLHTKVHRMQMRGGWGRGAKMPALAYSKHPEWARRLHFWMGEGQNTVVSCVRSCSVCQITPFLTLKIGNYFSTWRVKLLLCFYESPY